jgi:hypothetical protein
MWPCRCRFVQRTCCLRRQVEEKFSASESETSCFCVRVVQGRDVTWRDVAGGCYLRLLSWQNDIYSQIWVERRQERPHLRIEARARLSLRPLPPFLSPLRFSWNTITITATGKRETVWVWVCVWESVCVSECVWVWVCVWVSECGWVCVWVCMSECGWVCVWVSECVWVYEWVWVCEWVCEWEWVWVCVSVVVVWSSVQWVWQCQCFACLPHCPTWRTVKQAMAGHAVLPLVRFSVRQGIFRPRGHTDRGIKWSEQETDLSPTSNKAESGAAPLLPYTPSLHTSTHSSFIYSP